MCQFPYIGYQPCGCRYFEKEASYCKDVWEYFNGFSGKPDWMPKVVVKDDNASFDYEVDKKIVFQTEDVFRPIPYTECAHIEFLKQDTKEDCPWHKAKQMSLMRAHVKEQLKKHRKQQADKKKALIWREVKRWALALSFPLNGQ